MKNKNSLSINKISVIGYTLSTVLAYFFAHLSREQIIAYRVYRANQGGRGCLLDENLYGHNYHVMALLMAGVASIFLLMGLTVSIKDRKAVLIVRYACAIIFSVFAGFLISAIASGAINFCALN